MKLEILLTFSSGFWAFEVPFLIKNFHIKKTCKLFQNFSIIDNFDQLDVLRNFDYLAAENKQTFQAFFIQSEGENSERWL